VISYNAVERPSVKCFYDVEAPGSDEELPDVSIETDAGSDVTDDASTAA
jgi:hypothetical protein